MTDTSDDRLVVPVGPRDGAGCNVVVVGGGAAGLELATKLGDRLHRTGKGRVTLVERARTHIWKPLLHAIAAGSMDPGAHELNYLAQSYWHHFRYRFGEMVGLDREHRLVHLAATHDEDGRLVTPERSVPYDLLVIAIGSITNDFGTPGVAEHAVPLETTEQARRFNRRLINAALRAQTQAEAVRPGQLHVAIIGAGATGTELAAELHRTARALVAFGLDRIKSTDIRIVLIEAGPRILPALPEGIAAATVNFLVRLGVDVRTSARVTAVEASGVHLGDGAFIPAELVVWAAGVKAPDVLHEIGGLQTNRINQLVVTPTLQTTRDPAIFAMGDCAECPREGHATPIPPRAQAAHQQADHLFHQIQRQIEGKALEPFAYRDFGSLISLGRYSTVGSLMGFIVGRDFRVEGWFARLMYRSLYAGHEYALGGLRRTVAGLLARKLSRWSEPPVKLH